MTNDKGEEFIKDDRKNIEKGDRSLLIIEDDSSFSDILIDLVHERGFKCLIAGDGETGIHFADYYKPSAIILDIGLPGIDGWQVMERLKGNPETRHIPVHFITASDKTLDAMKKGAIGYLTKPVNKKELEDTFKRIESIIDKEVKKLLIVDDDKTEIKSIIELIGNGDVTTASISDTDEAYTLLRSDSFDCMILKPGIRDMSGFDLLEKIRNDKDVSQIPIIVYTAEELSHQQRAELKKYTDKIIIKEVQSRERLLDETTLFLHRVESNLSEEKKKMLQMDHDKESVFRDKKILLVDDDMRNVFALSSVLEEKGIKVIVGRNGGEGIEKLKENRDTSLVLMDIMMPEMDGYEAMRQIRKEERFHKLPIIALTAKAMKGDRNKCIEAGANDYLAKPINTDKMLSLLRVWMYK